MAKTLQICNSVRIIIHFLRTTDGGERDGKQRKQNERGDDAIGESGYRWTVWTVERWATPCLNYTKYSSDI